MSGAVSCGVRRATSGGFRSEPSTAWNVVTFRFLDRSTGAVITLARASASMWHGVARLNGRHVPVECCVSTLAEAATHVRVVVALDEVGRTEGVRLSITPKHFGATAPLQAHTRALPLSEEGRVDAQP